MTKESMKKIDSRTVDVIIPVYGQLELAKRCIDSVLNSNCTTALNLIVIEDCSPDTSVSVELEEYSKKENFVLLKNPKNLGFPATCNRAFGINPKHDVLILNSDTQVFGDWLDRITAVAYSDASIGTVTPLTNDGEISSYPNWLKVNLGTLETPDKELDELAGVVNSGEWHEAPTGVGFCMYFKRECLDSVGYFDAEAFGKGYGEENDFCQRAIQANWLNVITPSVFVRHDGGSSFGSSKAERIASAIQVMERRHPGYNESVADFIRRDPLKKARERIDIGRIKRRIGDKSILMITHNWGGGTERHVRELRHSLESSGVPTLICRPDKNDPDLFEISDDFTFETPNLLPLRISDSPHEFRTRLEELGVSHVHVHNLAGYSQLMRDYIPDALFGSSITYDMTIHDYQYWCPQITLVGITGLYCGEPSPKSCQTCIQTLGSPFGNVSVWDWRRGYERLLRGARAVFAPSNDAAKRVERHIPGLTVEIRPHEVVSTTVQVELSEKPPSTVNPIPKHSKTKRIGIIGALSKEKGAEILLDSAKHVYELGLDIDFVVIGHTFNDDAFREIGNINVLGRYEEQELDAIIRGLELDAIWFPAILPETFSYTLTSALKTGLPIVAFDIGAISERLKESGTGTIVPLKFARNPNIIIETLFQSFEKIQEKRAVSSKTEFTKPLKLYYKF